MLTIHGAFEKVGEKEALFRSLLSRLKIVEDDACGTLGTDGENLYYSKDFFNSLSDGERCAVVLHEVLHCAFIHPWRRGERDMNKWNQACDYAINITVSENFPLPEGSLIDMQYYGMSAEAIYDALPDPPKQNGKGEGEDSNQNQPSQGKPQSWCDKDYWEDPKDGDKAGSEKKSLIDKVFGKKKKTGKRSRKQNEREWKKAFDEIVQQYGSLPESMKRLIQNSYYVPVVDWASLVAGILSEDTNDYTFSQPDRRFMESSFILPGLYSIDNVKDVVFAYDTSGSISSDDLHSYYEETMALMDNFTNLSGWAAVCDADLHSFQEISSRTGFDSFGFIGGGGTSFRPVFKEIEDRGLRPKALFYFTDTEGDFPSHPPDYPVFWLVRSQISLENYKLDVPFGTVVKFLGH